MLKRMLRIIWKRLTCNNHEYKQICRVFSTNETTGIEITFDYDFECLKCGKRLNVKMDKDYQLKNPTKRFTNR